MVTRYFYCFTRMDKNDYINKNSAIIKQYVSFSDNMHVAVQTQRKEYPSSELIPM